jgi:hypothetical protein
MHVRYFSKSKDLEETITKIPVLVAFSRSSWRSARDIERVLRSTRRIQNLMGRPWGRRLKRTLSQAPSQIKTVSTLNYVSNEKPVSPCISGSIFYDPQEATITAYK